MTEGLQYRLGKIADDGTTTVEVAEAGSNDWHTLHTHKTLEAAADQVHALTKSDAALNGQPLPPEDFVTAITQVLQVKPVQTPPKKPRW